MRARKLTKQCSRKMRNPTAILRLSNGTDPYTETLLSTAPRRLTTADVAYTGKEDDTWSSASITGCERPPPLAKSGAIDITRHTTGDVASYSDEDPFNFGFGLDEL